MGRLLDLMQPGRRTIVGLAGAPGAGKSTLAEILCTAVGPAAVVIPMDGFHLSNAQLAAAGDLDRKGAPHTLDVHGYVTLLRRLRAATPGAVYAPAFDRTIDDPIAASIVVPPDTTVIITEGNYLLRRRGGWQDVRPLLDRVWWVECDPALRRQRLVRRHQQFGRTLAEAEEFVSRSDELNAADVELDRTSADLVIAG